MMQFGLGIGASTGCTKSQCPSYRESFRNDGGLGLVVRTKDGYSSWRCDLSWYDNLHGHPSDVLLNYRGQRCLLRRIPRDGFSMYRFLCSLTCWSYKRYIEPYLALPMVVRFR